MSRLENVYKGEIREIKRLERRIERRLPIKGLVGVIITLALLTAMVLLLISLSIGGSISVDKKRLGNQCRNNNAC